MIACLRTVVVPPEIRALHLAWIDKGREVRQAHGIVAELVLEPANNDGETVVLTIWPSHEVFDTWIAGTNRSAAHTLIDEISLEQGILRMAFIDHASSMSFHGSPPWPDTVTEHSLPCGRDEIAMLQMVGNIAALDPAKIADLLDRIPAAYLPDKQERTAILKELTRRRDCLRSILEL